MVYQGELKKGIRIGATIHIFEGRMLIFIEEQQSLVVSTAAMSKTTSYEKKHNWFSLRKL